MRPMILMVPVLLGVTPLVAQYTPEQRRAIEGRSSVPDRRSEVELERRSLDGDPSAYGGVVAKQERLAAWQRTQWVRWYDRVSALPRSPEHWFSLDDHPRAIGALRRAGPADLTIRSGKQSVLTIASPIGAPGRSLMIRTAIDGAVDGSSWRRMGELKDDPSGRYIVWVPALTTGVYELQIAVYDPGHPDTAVSESRNRVVVQ